MFSNKGQNQQQQKQSGGYRITPSRQSTKRNSKSRTSTHDPLQNPAELQRVMALFQ